MENIDRMFELGLYLNDLSMHDVSRDLVLVGIQQSKQLKSMFNQVRFWLLRHFDWLIWCLLCVTIHGNRLNEMMLFL